MFFDTQRHACHHQKRDQDILTQLRILSNVCHMDRISTNNHTQPIIRIQKPGLWRTLERTYHSESRMANLNYIQVLLQTVIERYGDGTKRTPPSQITERLQSEMRGAIRGLRNLQQTYEDDAQFKSAIDVAIETAILHMQLKEDAPRDDTAPLVEAISSPPPKPKIVEQTDCEDDGCFGTPEGS